MSYPVCLLRCARNELCLQSTPQVGLGLRCPTNGNTVDHAMPGFTLFNPIYDLPTYFAVCNSFMAASRLPQIISGSTLTAAAIASSMAARSSRDAAFST